VVAGRAHKVGWNPVGWESRCSRTGEAPGPRRRGGAGWHGGEVLVPAVLPWFYGRHLAAASCLGVQRSLWWTRGT